MFHLDIILYYYLNIILYFIRKTAIKNNIRVYFQAYTPGKNKNKNKNRRRGDTIQELQY